jgi:hypothetical protein
LKKCGVDFGQYDLAVQALEQGFAEEGLELSNLPATAA